MGTRHRIWRAVGSAHRWWRWSTTGGTCSLSLAEPDKHHEAITSRPLLLHAIGERTTHARQTTIRIRSLHGRGGIAERMLSAVAAFLRGLKEPGTEGNCGAVDRRGKTAPHPVTRGARLAQRPPAPPATAIDHPGITPDSHSNVEQPPQNCEAAWATAFFRLKPSRPHRARRCRVRSDVHG